MRSPTLRRLSTHVAAVVSVLAVAQVASAATSVFDGYEAPVGAQQYSFPGAPGSDSQGRDYTGHAGIGMSTLGGAPRTGSQFAWMENFNGDTASIAQEYALDPGTYTLSYYEGGRAAPFGALTYDVLIDGVVRGSFITSSAGGAPTQLRTIPSFTVGAVGITRITFQGTAPNDTDNTGFFDDLSITAVPEPTGVALLGLGGLLLARRRRA